MKKYYIYHVPGKKIGVTTNISVRMRQQGFTDYEILEEHTDIYEVSNREQELQAQYGLPVDDCPYWQMVQNTKTPKAMQARRNRKGETRSAEQRAKISATKLSNPNRFHSDETKKIIGEASRNRPKIECPKCGKVCVGKSKFNQHYDSIKCKKAAATLQPL